MDMNVSCTIFRVAAATCNIPPTTTPPLEKTTDSYCIFSGARTAAPAPHRRDNSNHRNGTQAQTATESQRRLFDTLYLACDAAAPFPKSAHATAPRTARKLTKQKINTDVLFRLKCRDRQFTQDDERRSRGKWSRDTFKEQ